MARAFLSLGLFALVALFAFGCSQDQAPTMASGQTEDVTGSALGRIPNGPAGNSHVGHLYLFEKDPETWEIIEDGAWGKLRYKLKNDELDIVFNGHLLEPGYEYTLIRYIDPWPSTGVMCFGTAMANEEGDVHISGALPWSEEYTNVKLWLVLSEDVDCGNQMIGWNPVEYLFEYDLLFPEEE